MRIRVVAAGVCAVIALAGCSSSGTTPGSGSPGGSTESSSSTGSGGSTGTVSAAAFCQRFHAVSTKLSGLSNAVSNPSQLGNKLDPVIAQLQQLQSGAPSQVAPALQDLLSAMQTAEKAAHGGNMQQLEQQMQKLVPKLTKDFQQMESYVSKNCH